jgi:hypothetical protein
MNKQTRRTEAHGKLLASPLGIAPRWALNLKRVALTTLLLSLAGCQTPDLKPFADSTASMNTAVKEGQKLFIRELETIKAADKEATYVDKALNDFTNNWKLRIDVMNAMVEYSEQLAAVADSPRQRAENTKAIADAIGHVAQAFGPYGEAVNGVLDIGRKLDGLVAQVRAARTLQKAVQKADPIISNVVEVLLKDFQAMENTLRVERQALPGILRTPHSDALEARKKLLKQMPDLYKQLTDNGANAQAVANFNRDVAANATALAEMDRWYLPLAAQLKENDQRIAAGISLLSEARTGFRAWGNIHSKLASDIAERRQPNWRLLLETAREIQSDIERIKKHESN